MQLLQAVAKVELGLFLSLHSIQQNLMQVRSVDGEVWRTIALLKRICHGQAAQLLAVFRVHHFEL